MRYFVTILTLYINSSRAYTLYAYARSKYVYGRASRTLRKKKRGKEESKKWRKKKKRETRTGRFIANEE